MSLDIFYPVRPGDDNEELRYSLRSLRNIKHGRVFIVGHVPDWVTNVIGIELPKLGTYHRTAQRNIEHVIKHTDISDKFLYMNDDFFIMNPIEKMPTIFRGTLDGVIEKQGQRSKGDYYNAMVKTRDLIDKIFTGKQTLYSYEIHLPMVFDKAKLGSIFNIISQHDPEFHRYQYRTIYGNLFEIGGVQNVHGSIKVKRTADKLPSGDFASTNELTFSGQVGRQIRAIFPDKSPYEK